MQSSRLYPNIYAHKTYNDYLAERKQIKKAKSGDVIGMTLHASVVNLGLRNTAFKPNIVLVDEAGQIPMAYASIIGSYGCGSVIFIGDDNQMPPIFHPNLVGHSFSTSIFKYLCDKFPSLRKMLNITYRMNDDIASLVSSSFYESSTKGKIIPDSRTASRRSNFAELTEIGSNSIAEKIFKSTASVVIANPTPADSDETFEDSNKYEAKLVAEISKIFDHNGINPHDYAVICPYRRQVKLIRSLVGEDNAPLINTVECLQGQDVETIIISFAATDLHYIHDQLEFLLNPNRLNVMISRAKTKVVMLMSELLLKEYYKRYSSSIDSCSGVYIIKQ
jgi:superfamily I DNA and/or RNA helicase